MLYFNPNERNNNNTDTLLEIKVCENGDIDAKAFKNPFYTLKKDEMLNIISYLVTVSLIELYNKERLDL